MAKLTDLDKENIKKLYEQGKMDSVIKPYIIPSMQYKLQSLNHVNLGKFGDR